MPTVVRLDESVMRAIDQHLEKVAAVNRSTALRAGLRGAANIVKNRTRGKLPQPGYPGDKKDKKPLRDTLATRVYDYPSGKSVALAGYVYPAGAHGHLIEEGHRIVTGGTLKKSKGQKKARSSARTGVGRIVGRVRGYHYLDDADKETRPAQIAALEAGIKKALAQ